MGIKFHCPNGHKMNVKSFLAGKKGVCPSCGANVVVPMVSEGDAAPAAAKPKAATAAVAAGPALAETLVDEGAFPSAGAAGSASSAADFPETNAHGGGTNGAFVPPPSDDPMPAAIAQDPLAIWYTCTPTGDRYGPVSGEALHKWLGEGRVSAKSLVWRDGWAEWQRASIVFPKLNPNAAPADFSELFPGLAPKKPVAAPVADEPAKSEDLLADVLAGAAAATTSYMPASKRRTQKDKIVLFSMIMIGLTVFLGVALLLVILNR
jgi:hypothetical protein